MREQVSLIALCHFPLLPSGRIRIEQLVPELARRGVELQLAPYPRTRPEVQALLPELERSDVVLVQKELPRREDLGWLRSLSKPLVLDFDDAVMLRREKKWGSHLSLKRALKFRRACRTFDAFICGNAWLAQHCPDKPTLVSPSPVPLGTESAQARGSNEIVRIGWVGLGCNLPSLDLIAPALSKLSATKRFQLVVISDESPALDCCDVVYVPWSLARQEQDLAALDIGIMPLELDDAWSRGKCAYKLLQYMAVGLPVVGSDVGMNREVVDEGVNGFLARTQDQWSAALSRLLDDEGLRRTLGEAGRALVQRDFSYTVTAERWADFLRERVLGA